MLKYAYLDDHLIDTGRPHLYLDDRAWHFGDGVFETLLFQNGHALFADEHWARLTQGCVELDLDVPMKLALLAETIGELAMANEVEIMLAKIVIWRAGSADILKPLGKASRMAIICRIAPDYPESVYERGVEVVSFRMDRSSISSIKSLCYLTSVLARHEAARSNAFEAIFVTSSGLVEEASAANVMVVKGDALLVPDHARHILPGVTQKAVIELAGRYGLEPIWKPLTYEELLDGDEIMLTFTSAGVVPVIAVDGRKIGRGTPGHQVSSLVADYKALISSYE